MQLTMTRPTTTSAGSDLEAIQTLLKIHAPVGRMADVTFNEGRIWNGYRGKLLRSDRNAELDLDVACDFRALPYVDQSMAVLVFDPPHLPTRAITWATQKDYRKRFGVVDEITGSNVVELFEPFLIEAKRVLAPGGVVLAKIADLIHNHRYQWQQVEFVKCAQACGMTACDMIVLVDRSTGHFSSGRWTSVKHLRKSHCYWIVVRNGASCERIDTAAGPR